MKYELQNGWKKFDDKEAVYSYAEGYKEFLNCAKTERESISEAVRLAEEKGFRDINTFKELKKGDKVYIINNFFKFFYTFKISKSPRNKFKRSYINFSVFPLLYNNYSPEN